MSLTITVYGKWHKWDDEDIDEPTTTKEFTNEIVWEIDDGPMIDWAIEYVRRKLYVSGRYSYSSSPADWYPHGWYSYPDGSVDADHYTGEREEISVFVSGATDAVLRAIHYGIIRD